MTLLARPVSPWRLARLARGWRLHDVAEETGVSESLISRVERGLVAPAPDLREKLERAYQR